MTMQELLKQAMNICNKLTGVYNVDIWTPDDITILFKNSKGYKYLIRYYIKSNKLFIDYINCHERDENFSELDYSQEELTEILKKVNK